MALSSLRGSMRRTAATWLRSVTPAQTTARAMSTAPLSILTEEEVMMKDAGAGGGVRTASLLAIYLMWLL